MICRRLERLNDCRSRNSRQGLTEIDMVYAVAIFAVLFAMLVPARNGEPVSKRTLCKNNLKQISLALHNYADTYEVYPPAYTVDEQGNRLHSWRTLILPFLEQGEISAKIDFSKPWDDPANSEARQTMIKAYVCPELRKSLNTSYLAIVTPDSFFKKREGSKVSEMQDSPSETMMIIEVSPSQSVHWMNPAEANEVIVTQALGQSRLNHKTGIHAAFVDGSVRFLPKGMPAAQIHALITASGNDVVGDSGDF